MLLSPYGTKLRRTPRRGVYRHFDEKNEQNEQSLHRGQQATLVPADQDSTLDRSAILFYILWAWYSGTLRNPILLCDTTVFLERPDYNQPPPPPTRSITLPSSSQPSSLCSASLLTLAVQETSARVYSSLARHPSRHQEQTQPRAGDNKKRERTIIVSSTAPTSI